MSEAGSRRGALVQSASGRLAQRDAAVDRDPLAGDVACGVAGEERREMTDVLRRLLAPEGHAALHHLEEHVARGEVREPRLARPQALGQALPRARPEEAGADRV